MFSLVGYRAVVTGAASGIGLAIAQTFTQAGARVVLIDLDRKGVDAAASKLPGALAISCDVSSASDVLSAFTEVGPDLDILVNCAGIAHIGTLGSTSVADLDRLYAVNVRGTSLCMQEAIKAMLAKDSGVILNMGSIAASAGLADRYAYSMTKGAVLAMTLSVARDYLTKGIRCNSISPARIHTPFVDGFLAKNYPGEESRKMAELAASQPIGRMGKPSEVAALALYLCSAEAAFVTGVDYPIDGGFLNLR